MTDLVVSYFLHNFFLHNQQDPNINCIFSAKPSNIVNIKQSSGTQPKRISSCFKMHKQPDALEHQKSASASASANTSSGPVPSLQNYLKMHTLLTCTTHSPFTCTLMPFNSAPSAFISPHNAAPRILAYCARGSALCHTKKKIPYYPHILPGLRTGWPAHTAPESAGTSNSMYTGCLFAGAFMVQHRFVHVVPLTRRGFVAVPKFCIRFA